jgi:hypothetical protein
MSEWLNSKFEGKHVRVLSEEEMRKQQADFVAESIVAAEQGHHQHYPTGSGGVVFCNWDPTCRWAEPVSGLMY